MAATFHVLGPLQVLHGERTVALGGPMQRAVLALLVLDANRTVPIHRLIGWLWGDNAPRRAVGTVQAYVSNLRRVLEPERRPGQEPRVLVSRPSGYALLVEPDAVDWVRCEQLAERARAARNEGNLPGAGTLYRQARALWRGAPLCDLAVAGLNETVHRLDGLRLALAEEHAEVLLELDHPEEAVDLLAGPAAEAPLRERMRGLQMLALYRAGRQVEALEVYAQVRAALADEHGLDPGADLRRLHEQVLRQDAALEPERPPRPLPGNGRDGAGFVGRTAELAALVAQLQAVGTGGGRTVLVEGEPGIGKTRLVEAVADTAARQGFLAAWGRCAEGEGAPGLWPWIQVLRDLDETGDLASLVRPELRSDPRTARGAMHLAMAGLLRERAGRQPILIVLDDLHWADEASLALTEFLAAQIRTVAVLVVVIYREVDLPRAPALADTLGILARLAGTVRVSLTGLSIDEVGALIRQHLRAPLDEGVAAAVRDRTNGNPFFVTELLRLGDPRRLAAGPVPASVRDVVRRRVARLPPPTRRLLETAALVGHDVDVRFVAGVCGLDVAAGLAAAEAAAASGLLSPVPDGGGEYRFTHALVAETLVAGLPATAKADRHDRIAAALLSTFGADDRYATAIAEHLWRAQPLSNVRPTLAAQTRAADVAWIGLAYEQAESLLQRASTLLRQLPSDQAPDEVDFAVHMRLGSLRSARRGYTAEVREVFDRARMIADRLGKRDDLLPALWGLSATAVVRGDLDAADELTRAALDEARALPAGPALATSHQGVGIVAFYRGHLASAREQFAAALDAWRRAAVEPPVLRGPPASARPNVMAPSYDALAASLMGAGDAAAEQIAAALRAAKGTGEPYAVAFVHSFHARLAVLNRDPPAAADAANHAVRLAEEYGFPLLAEHATIPLGWARARLGDPRNGLADIERGLATLHRSGQRILTPFHRGLQAEVLLMLGDPTTAHKHLVSAVAETTARGGGFELPALHHLRAVVLAALGDADAAAQADQLAAAEAARQQARTPVTTI